jgi:hypothetical protein
MPIQADIAIKQLIKSDEPSIRYKLARDILKKELTQEEIDQYGIAIKESERVKILLSEQDETGKIPFSPYAKWTGAHWVMATLADLAYPPEDETLVPLREQVLNWLLSEGHQKHIRVIQGRVRRCASQESNAVYALLTLGLADERVDEFAKRLTNWQWPDGGWNCDKRKEVQRSSFMETLLPLRALALHAQITGDSASKSAAEQAAEIFLRRKLFRRLSDGKIMDPHFVELHYPCYWHYDILFGLKVMAEAGFISDPRCQEALDVLESKELPTGGFPAEKKYYAVSDKIPSGRSTVNWGGTSKRRMNPFVTLDALFVLRTAGRI